MRDSEPMVSVIVPTHKGMNLDLLVESVLNSTYKNVELVIVDEGLERSKQRNIGIQREEGYTLCFLIAIWRCHLLS